MRKFARIHGTGLIMVLAMLVFASSVQAYPWNAPIGRYKLVITKFRVFENYDYWGDDEINLQFYDLNGTSYGGAARTETFFGIDEYPGDLPTLIPNTQWCVAPREVVVDNPSVGFLNGASDDEWTCEQAGTADIDVVIHIKDEDHNLLGSGHVSYDNAALGEMMPAVGFSYEMTLRSCHAQSAFNQPRDPGRCHSGETHIEARLTRVA